MVTARPHDWYRNREVTGFLLSLAFAWLSFFFALRTIEPALVQVLFYGIGPHPPIRSSTGLDGSMVYNGPAHRAVPELRC